MRIGCAHAHAGDMGMINASTVVLAQTCSCEACARRALQDGHSTLTGTIKQGFFLV